LFNRLLRNPPAFRIYGKGKGESSWRVIEVYASGRRNFHNGWPLICGTCITWSSRVINVGWDFAENILREQIAAPASREAPVEVGGGCLRLVELRKLAGVPDCASASEVMAHECGHTCQAIWLWPFYLLSGALFTWWREGSHWWNYFENDASATGQFGGIVNGSVHPELWKRVTEK
jgi:hypothetical protein